MRPSGSRPLLAMAVAGAVLVGPAPAAALAGRPRAVGGRRHGRGSGARGRRPCSDPTLAEAGFECATLRVPGTAVRPAGATVALALVRHRATGTAAQRIGSLIFNPGGPGGSGVSAIPGVWDLVPPSVRERFDLVSWDPRGVGESAPSLTADRCPSPYPRRPATGSVNWPT